MPPALEPLRARVLSIVEQLEELQREGAHALGIDAEGVPFHVKKEVTSALRRLAPIGLSTDIIWTANVRTLRHVIEMRTDEGAEEELRLVFDQVARIMQVGGARALPGLRARATTAPGCPSTTRSSAPLLPSSNLRPRHGAGAMPPSGDGRGPLAGAHG